MPEAQGSNLQQVLIAGAWRASAGKQSFHASNPATGATLTDAFPVSPWSELDEMLAAAVAAHAALKALPDSHERVAAFLDGYAAAIESEAEQLSRLAQEETALPFEPRLKNIEVPRTVNQLRLAAKAAKAQSWARPTIDAAANIRSCLAPLGVVWVIGPNNFPFAFNGISGGDFAAAIASGNAVIAKGHPLHPATSRRLAEHAQRAADEAGLPVGMVQLFYHAEPADGLRMIRDDRLSAVAFTGSRGAGLRLKAAADEAGKPFFGEMSSINPVVVLPGALAEASKAIAEQFATSALAGAGQFCTKPGLLLLPAGQQAEAFIDDVRDRFEAAPVAPLFSSAACESIQQGVQQLTAAGAKRLTGGKAAGEGFRNANTLLRITGEQFLADPHRAQTELFGNATVIVTWANLQECLAILQTLEGNLTGTIYSAAEGADDAAYDEVAIALRPRVGRLLNDKMPTGVAVSPAMNHGGPFPATSNAHFTAVGMPGAIERFTRLECYDGVRPHRLPAVLRDAAR